METEASYHDNKNALYKPDHKDATEFKDWNDWQKLPGNRFFIWEKNPHCSIDLNYTKRYQNGYAKLTTSFFSALHDRSDNGPVGFNGRLVQKIFNGKLKLDADGSQLKTLYDFGTIETADCKINPFVQGVFKIDWRTFPGLTVGGANSSWWPDMGLTDWRSRWQVGAITTKKLGDWRWHNVTMAGMAGFRPAPFPVKTTLELANPDAFNLVKNIDSLASKVEDGANEMLETMTQNERATVQDSGLEEAANQMLEAVTAWAKSDNEQKYSFTCNNSFVRDTKSHNLSTSLEFDSSIGELSSYAINYSFLQRYAHGNKLSGIKILDGAPTLTQGWVTQTNDTVQAYHIEADMIGMVYPYIGFKTGRDIKLAENLRAKMTWSTANTFRWNVRGVFDQGKLPVRVNLSASYHPKMEIYDFLADLAKGISSFGHGGFGYDVMRNMNSISPQFKWGVNVECGDL